MTKRDLLDALTAERYDNRWWTGKVPPTRRVTFDDSELTCARRRRVLLSDVEDVPEASD